MKIAVMGTGSAGSRHLRVLQSLDGVTPVAVPLRPSRISELEASGFTVAPDLATARSMGVTAVVVATETGRHPEDVASAIQAGLDVLLEKPMAVDSIQAHSLWKLASQSGQKLYVGYDLRFSESLNEFRNKLAMIGKTHSVRIEAMSYLPDWRPGRPFKDSYSARSAEGGVLRDLIHEIDYSGWIFGWPESCMAIIKNFGRLDIEAEEMAELIWETTTGCFVSIGLDYLTRPPRRRITAQGAKGTMAWDAFAGTVKIEVDGVPGETIQFPVTRDQDTMALDQAFVDACNEVIDHRLADGEDGYRALAVCDASRRASTSQKLEPVDYQ